MLYFDVGSRNTYLILNPDEIFFTVVFVTRCLPVVGKFIEYCRTTWISLVNSMCRACALAFLSGCFGTFCGVPEWRTSGIVNFDYRFTGVFFLTPLRAWNPRRPDNADVPCVRADTARQDGWNERLDVRTRSLDKQTNYTIHLPSRARASGQYKHFRVRALSERQVDCAHSRVHEYVRYADRNTLICYAAPRLS